MSSLSFYDWGEPEQKASRIVFQYEEWQSYKEGAMNEWEEIEAYLYATDTTSLNDAFDHTTHIPILSEIKEDLEAIMYATILPHDDWLGWRPHDFEAAVIDKRDKALAYVNNRNNLNGFRKTIRKLIHDYVVYGNAFVQVYHCNENRVSKDGTLIPGYYGPKLTRISPYDIVFDPTVECFEKTPKIVRELISIGEFSKRAKQLGWDADTVKLVLERRNSNRQTGRSEPHKNQQYVPDGFNSIEAYLYSGKVEILWFYGDVFDDETLEVHESRCVGVVDRFHVLFDYEVENPRIHKAGWGLRPDNLWSQSPLSKIVGMNFQINHRENAKSTSLDKFIYPDRVLSGDVEEVYDDETGQTRYIGIQGSDVRDISPDGSILAFDTQVDRLLSLARSAARLPPQLVGFRTPGEKTLGEAQLLQDGAFRGFIHKAEQFELDLLEPAITDELEIGADTLSTALIAETDTANGIRYINITKDDLRSNGKLVPYGARRFSRDIQQLTMLQQLGNSNLANIIQNHIISANLARTVERLGGFEKYTFIEKFGAIDEAVEMQSHQQAAEQTIMNALDNPSLAEAEAGVQLSGGTQDTSIPE